MNSSLLLCVKMKKGLCKNDIYYYMYYTYCVPFPLLYLLCEISNPYFNAPVIVKNSPPLSPWKGSSCVFKENGCNCISVGSQSFCVLNISAVRTPTVPLFILSEKHQSLITEKVIPITLSFQQFLICKYSETLKLNTKATAKLLTRLSNSAAGFSPPCDFGSAH